MDNHLIANKMIDVLRRLMQPFPMLEILVVLSILDMISGVIVAMIKRTLNSYTSFRGISRKTLMFMAVMVMYILENQTTFPIPVGQATAFWYVMNEALSIMENLHAANVPLPPQITKWLKTAQKSVEDKIEQKKGGKGEQQ